MQCYLDIQILCEIFAILCPKSHCNLAGMQCLIELKLLLLRLFQTCGPSGYAAQRRNCGWLEKVLLLLLLRLNGVRIASSKLLRLSDISVKVLTCIKSIIYVLGRCAVRKVVWNGWRLHGLMWELTLSTRWVCWFGTARWEHRNWDVWVIVYTFVLLGHLLLLLLHAGNLLVIWWLLFLSGERLLLMHHAYCVIILIVTKILGPSILAI